MNQYRIPQSGKALALGDGEERNSVFLAELGLQVTSVDLSEVGLSKARDLAMKRGVAIRTVQADLENYEIDPESQDLIVSIYCHLPEAIRKLVHERASRRATAKNPRSPSSLCCKVFGNQRDSDC